MSLSIIGMTDTHAESDTETELSRWDWFSILISLALVVLGPVSFFIEGSLLGILFTLGGMVILFRYGRWLLVDKDPQ